MSSHETFPATETHIGLIQYSQAMPRSCEGLDGAPCIFSTTQPGKAAQPVYGRSTCVFCNFEALEAQDEREHGQKDLIRRLAVAWLQAFTAQVDTNHPIIAQSGVMTTAKTKKEADHTCPGPPYMHASGLLRKQSRRVLPSSGPDW